MRLNSNCPLCLGLGLLPARIAERPPVSRLQFGLRIAMQIRYGGEWPLTMLCCQLCDSGEVTPIDVLCDPDVY